MLDRRLQTSLYCIIMVVNIESEVHSLVGCSFSLYINVPQRVYVCVYINREPLADIKLHHYSLFQPPLPAASVRLPHLLRTPFFALTMNTHTVWWTLFAFRCREPPHIINIHVWCSFYFKMRPKYEHSWWTEREKTCGDHYFLRFIFLDNFSKVTIDYLGGTCE